MVDIDDVSQDLSVALSARTQTGILEVVAISAIDGSYLEAELQIVESGQAAKTPFTVTLPVGSYTIMCSYKYQGRWKGAVIVGGETTPLLFSFQEMPAQAWYRISVSASPLSVKIGDLVMFEGGVEKQCPDGSWVESNLDCATRQHDSLYARFHTVRVKPIYDEEASHVTMTDEYGKYRTAFPLTKIGSVLPEVSVYIPWAWNVEPKAQDGIIRVDSGIPPVYSVIIDSLLNHCDIEPPQLRFKGRALMNDLPLSCIESLMVLVDGVYAEGVSRRTRSDGSFDFILLNPPSGAHRIGVELWIAMAPKVRSNEVGYVRRS